jgi:CHRD domain-containing protein
MSKAAFIVIAGLCFAACSSDAPKPTAPFSVPVFESSDKSDNANGGNFGTPMSSAEEPMPANVHESNARGSAIFHLNEAGTELEYKLIVANIENVFQAHIHNAVAGVNGPIVVWLYPSTAAVAGPFGQGRIEGVIAEGTIRAANFVGPLAGHPMADLIAMLKNGTAYVNAHTNDGIAPTNTGPGDFPGGEIRGQVEHRGH